MRADIADVRLADRVFAPHYAAPLPRVLVLPATLASERNGLEVLAQLAAGDVFDLLDHTGGDAWGIARTSGLVGYLPAAALGLSA